MVSNCVVEMAGGGEFGHNLITIVKMPENLDVRSFKTAVFSATVKELEAGKGMEQVSTVEIEVFGPGISNIVRSAEMG